MSLKRVRILFSIIFILFITNVLSTFIDSDIIIIPSTLICDFFSASIVLYVYKIDENFKASWFMLGLVCLFYGIGDTVWSYFDLTGTKFPEINITTFIYILPNLFLLGSVLAYLMKRKRSWDNAQLFIDVTTITLIASILFWILVLNREFNMLLQFEPRNTILFISLLLDFLTLSSLAVIYITTSVVKVPYPHRLLIIGVLTHSISDIVYVFEEFNQTYEHLSFLDMFYGIALLIFASAALTELYNPSEGSLKVLNTYSKDKDFGKRIYILYFAPIIITFVEGFNLRNILLLIGIILLREWISSYFRTFKNEALLSAEKNLNEKLEDLIRIRTEELLESNKRLEVLTKQDDLTGLFNRRYFTRVFDEMAESLKEYESIVLFFMDLDNFKVINDTFGHMLGDQVLKEISNRLKLWNNQDMLLFRMGGDEFIVVYKGRFDKEYFETVANSLIACINEPVVIFPNKIELNSSMGISCYPQDGDNLNSVLKNADIAMYQAKEKGRGNHQFYTKIIAEGVNRKNTVQLALKTANLDEEFELYYQPQFEIPQKKLIGAEALLRWKSPSLGFVSPAEFIPLAEEIGFITVLGRWVLVKALLQASEWNRNYLKDIRIGINVSPKQLEIDNFISILESELKNNLIKTQWLDIEITETSAMKLGTQIESILTRLSDMGCSVSIDDFGTGYSSLSYIKRFAINRLKIAKELIDEIVTDANSEQIITAIILMSKGIGLKTIAEGVETEMQLEKLVQLGCSEIQGYLLGRPVSAAEFEQKYLRN